MSEFARPVVGITSARTRLVDGERQKDDWYATPPRATLALLSVEDFPLHIWECACGDGRMAEVLKDAGYLVTSTDLVDRGYGESRRDFLLERNLLAPTIVTNPPFKLADQFALHAISLGVEKMALLQRLAWLEGGARHDELYSKFPPVRVWVFSRRITLWRGDDPNPQDKGGVMALAWYVFERGFQGAPEIGWLT